jgi:polyhydroxyalkanoate synthesis repressor PhaR
MASPPSRSPRITPTSGVMVFKKYGNRRLYDLGTSKYVTLAEVEKLVQQGAEIQVLDAKTQADLTKEILVQIILERDSAKELLPTSFLRQVVRMQGSPLKESFTRLLQDSLDGFVRTQHTLFDAQRSLLQGAMQPPSNGPFMAWSPFRASPVNNDGDVAQLRQEMNHTQQLLQQLLQQQQQQQPATQVRRKATIRKRRPA